MDDKLNKAGGENEGEGSKTADKNYRDSATSFAKSHDTLKKGLEAEREVESNQSEFDAAEKAGRAHGAKDLPDDVQDFGKKKL
jgi:hypothetical protein